MYRRCGKRFLDLLVAATSLVALSPVFLFVSAAIALESPGSPVFRQARVGCNGRRFVLYKFRSMVLDACKYGKGFYFDGERDPRLTRVGRFIRRTSLDEIPQLINVLVGDMSLVGPRPMLEYQYKYLSNNQKRRFLVKPGITGLAQVSGRNTVPWSQRIALDVEYIARVSLCLDLNILLKTVLLAFTGKGVDYHVSPSEVEDFIPEEGLRNEHQREKSHVEGARTVRHGKSTQLPQ